MKVDEFIRLLDKAKRRWHLIGENENGLIAVLDLEGRLFTFIKGEMLSRVNEEAVSEQSTRDKYQNPGGDVLWPAPEGTCFGYEYSTGKWRVPPGITGARYLVKESGENRAVIEAEIDLINSRGLGLPCIFRRDIRLKHEARAMTVNVVETIIYIGNKTLSADDCMMAPWSLCQFDSGEGAEVVFPHVEGSVRDLYEPSDSQRFLRDGFCHTKTDGAQRYQIAIDERVDWIEYRYPERNLRVHRTALKCVPGLKYIDIADAAPESCPSEKGVRFSVYSDMNKFMEIEAVGASPALISNGISMSVEVYTKFAF
ncbi:MAG: hypothetical protein A2017_20020 [Lentisphaerae bacterium GWF2_44_16]|nr:MAG: hypothetical protein A2017_20020 [Lentisphaerae bacterium GWF2_44_16]